MLKISINLLLITISFFNIGCTAENSSRLECPKLAHQYGLVNSGVKMCYEDEKKNPEVCNNRLYNDFSNQLDYYITPYLQAMKELDANYKNVYKLDVELFACGSFCKKLRAEIMRLYHPNMEVNRYQTLKNYIQNLKKNYASAVGVEFTQNRTDNHEPINTTPIKKRITLKDVPQNCRSKYKLYLKEERTKNRNVQMLNTTINNLNSCIQKERGK